MGCSWSNQRRFIGWGELDLSFDIGQNLYRSSQEEKEFFVQYKLNKGRYDKKGEWIYIIGQFIWELSKFDIK